MVFNFSLKNIFFKSLQNNNILQNNNPKKSNKKKSKLASPCSL